MIGFDLHDRFSGCPDFWQNFVRQYNPDNSEEGERVVDDVLQKEFRGYFCYRDGPKKWRFLPNGRKFQYISQIPFVEFETETDMIVFKLRWV